MQRTFIRNFTRRTPVLLEQEGWRDHISYVKYLNIATTSLHKVVKDKQAPKYQRFSVAGYEAQESDGSGLFVKITKVPGKITDY